MLTHRQSGLSALFFCIVAFIASLILFLTLIPKQSDLVTKILILGIVVILGIIFCVVMLSAITGRVWAIQVYLGILVFIIDAVLIRRPEGMVGIDWYSLMKFVVALGAFLIGISQWKSNEILLSSPVLLWMFVYGLWAIFSSVYSVTPVYSFAAGVIFISYLFFASTIAQLLSLKKILTTVLISWGVFYVLSLAAYFLLPELGQTQAWGQSGVIVRFCGLAGEPNNMARILALMVVVLLGLYATRNIGKQWFMVILLAIILGLIMTMSRTTIMCVFFAFLAYFLRRNTALIIPSLFFSIFFVIIITMANSVDISKFSRSGSIEEVTTFTGRTEIWSFCWNEIKKEPLLGYGYAGSRKVISQGYESQFGFITKSAHNMWIQNLLSVGIIGTLPLIFVIVLLLRNFVRKPNLLRDMTLVVVLVSGMLEGGAMGSTPNLLTLFWLISMAKVVSPQEDIFV